MIIWLDDVRDPSKYLKEGSDYIWAKNYKEFVREYELLLNNKEEIVIDFDHDLGEDLSGYDCAWYVINKCMDLGFTAPPIIRVHSQNPVGSENIKKLFDNYENERKKRKRDFN